MDPRRRARICATEAEKAAAKLVFDGVREDLRTRRWGEPALVVDSGSGFHGWYPVDLPRAEDWAGTAEPAVASAGVLDRPLRVLAFGARESLNAFSRRALLYSGNLDGMYLPWSTRTIVRPPRRCGIGTSRTARPSGPSTA